MGSHVMWAHVKPMIPKSAQEGFLGSSVDPRPELLTQLAWGGQVLEWPGLGVCICDKLPSDVDAAGPRTIFWELLLWRNDRSEMPKLHVEHQAPCLDSSSHLSNGASMMGSWHSGRAIPTLYDLPRGPGHNTLLGAQGTVLWLCPLGLCEELLSLCTLPSACCVHIMRVFIGRVQMFDTLPGEEGHQNRGLV